MFSKISTDNIGLQQEQNFSWQKVFSVLKFITDLLLCKEFLLFVPLLSENLKLFCIIEPVTM